MQDWCCRASGWLGALNGVFAMVACESLAQTSPCKCHAASCEAGMADESSFTSETGESGGPGEARENEEAGETEEAAETGKVRETS